MDSGQSGAASASATNASTSSAAVLPATVDDCMNMDEIESLAASKLSKKAYAYYFSAADDLVSKSNNNTIYQSISLRPKVFVDATTCDTSATLLGDKLSLPIFVSPAAQARLGHPSGEWGIAQACKKYGACQIISNAASQRPEDICRDAPPNQVFGWQMYIMADRTKNEAFMARINKIPNIKFIVLTLDAVVIGKREHDEREGKAIAASRPPPSVQVRPSSTISNSTPHDASTSTGGRGAVISAMSMGTALDISWKETLPWVAKHTSLPIVIKGVQTYEDAYLASLYPQYVKAIVLSNHGGREADTAPPAIHTLLEIRKHCPEVFDRVEVWLDGGIKRGSDIVKALCLGAKGVGLGRNILYGLSAGGIEGVERVFEILKAELETAMRLLGAKTIDELGPHLVRTPAIHQVVRKGAEKTTLQVNTSKVDRDIYEEATSMKKLRLWIQSKL